jgi:hypothetical protein
MSRLPRWWLSLIRLRGTEAVQVVPSPARPVVWPVYEFAGVSIWRQDEEHGEWHALGETEANALLTWCQGVRARRGASETVFTFTAARP